LTLFLLEKISDPWIGKRSPLRARNSTVLRKCQAITEIVDNIKKQKKKKVCNQIELVKKMRDFL